MNRIAHQEIKRINAPAILIKYRTTQWGIAIGIPIAVDHVNFHPLSKVHVGIGARGNLKKVVSRESCPGVSTPRMIG